MGIHMPNSNLKVFFFPFKTVSRELLGAVIDILSMNLAVGLVGYLNDLEVPFGSYGAGYINEKRKSNIVVMRL